MLREMAEFHEITQTAPITVAEHGGRAKCLQRLVRLDLPVPQTVAISFDTVHQIAAGHRLDTDALLAVFGEAPLVSVRPSSEDPDWGGPGAILNIGMNDDRHAELVKTQGQDVADRLYRRFVQTFAIHVARLDPDMFDGQKPLAEVLDAYEDETDEAFPQDPGYQLHMVLRSMARAWEGTTARLLRQAKGAPADAGLGLIVQRMAFGIGAEESGSGVIQFVDPTTGLPQITGRYMSQSQGRDALAGDGGVLYLTRDPRGPSLEEQCDTAFKELIEAGKVCRTKLREEMQIEFTIEAGHLHILDAVRVQRSSRASVRIAVELAREGVISKEEALLRIEPRALSELMHSQVDPRGKRDRFARGIAASPGAASGKLVFSSAAAQASAARDEACVLVRQETQPEDIRGMHAANAVLTVRGGVTSHAAVIARGLGLPCVVGASDITLRSRDGVLVTADGRTLNEGDLVTIDGGTGEALMGEVEMLPPAVDDCFSALLSWAEELGGMKVRANADTPDDARTARRFGADGIGLCRTEHMFFEGDRLTVMRETIFADEETDRRAALDQLLPMQREDFVRLFQIMEGLPVCIRLFDPPLHEFMPRDRSGIRAMAEALDLPISQVTRRIEALSEFNPMLGMRGVRLGVLFPEIYEMQARAIFEATIEAGERGRLVEPEIMIPLVSAMREVELVKNSVDAIAVAVHNQTGAEFKYKLGVMVETPRAALRAGDIASHAAFLSFGTNDLTQMTYGLSRDDAGRFMGAYVQQGVYPEDPFHTLDLDGVGELLLIGVQRAREAQKDVVISICGEHGGNPESIAFCQDAGVDYVSCSPFRVPIARLAIAHAVLRKAHGAAA
ncbi:putative PEP-binding protein [Actibacterium pelagium]|uniref:Pyruvate, phosphate dikinase n=1 Tax=Actibacterium pelagium TaxID=2029103 RepID=A0A917AFZ8_9RHOB|nr:putative PEP-binding protein [Actibacterium pelagium]GGE47771.1 pyruvate, phosphate dikinase [Actibacterium pelagium]